MKLSIYLGDHKGTRAGNRVCTGYRYLRVVRLAIAEIRSAIRRHAAK